MALRTRIKSYCRSCWQTYYYEFLRFVAVFALILGVSLSLFRFTGGA